MVLILREIGYSEIMFSDPLILNITALYLHSNKIKHQFIIQNKENLLIQPGLQLVEKNIGKRKKFPNIIIDDVENQVKITIFESGSILFTLVRKKKILNESYTIDGIMDLFDKSLQKLLKVIY